MKKKKEIKAVPKGHFADICRNFSRNKTAMVALVILLLILLAAIFAGFIVDYQTKVLMQDPRMRLLPPSPEHWLGTDNFGRDLFGRIIHGARYSLFFGIACTAISLTLGFILGAAAAYYGGLFDSIIMRITDTFMCIPFLLLALTIAAVGGPGLMTMTVAITIASVPGFTRMARSVVISVVSSDFIEAARSCGTKDAAIIFGHVLPNAVGPIIVNCMMNMAGIIMAAAGLSYLGMGIQPPTPEWGSMLAESMQYFRTFPHVALCAGIAIMVTALCFNLVGDGLADAIDPKRRS